MLTHHHLSSSLPPCWRSLSRPVASSSSALHIRTFSFSHPRRDEVSPGRSTHPPESAKPPSAKPPPWTKPNVIYLESYKEFMKHVGKKFKYAKPSNWMNLQTAATPETLERFDPDTIGPYVPFAANPSFKPPRPLSDLHKKIIFQKFLSDPLANSPRKLAQRYNLSLKRVDAILRLKGLERDLEKGLPLQISFQKGMDRLLNAYTHPALLSGERVSEFDTPTSHQDVSEVDALEQEEKRDAVRYRYERLYWESTPEDGREPILPGVLAASKERALLREKSRKEAATRMLQGRLPKNPWITRPTRSSFVAWRKGRVPTRFVDVGAEFVTLEDLVKHKATQKLKRKQRRSRAADRKVMLRQLKSKSKQ